MIYISCDVMSIDTKSKDVILCDIVPIPVMNDIGQELISNELFFQKSKNKVVIKSYIITSQCN